MPTANSRVTSIQPTITQNAIASLISSSMQLAGYTPIDDYTDASGNRILGFSSPSNPGIFIEVRVTSARAVSQRLATSWDAANHTVGAIATPLNSAATFTATTKVTATSINHPEVRLVMLEQGTTVCQFLGIFTPTTRHPGWGNFPYAFQAAINTLANFNPFPSANNPYASSTNYPALAIAQMSLTGPGTNKPDIIPGAAMIMSPNNKGFAGIFSTDVAVCSPAGNSRGTMLNDYLLLGTTAGSWGVKSNIPT